MSPELDQLGINVIRGLAMDAPLKANSGHQGTAMALAPLAHVLFTRIMNFDAAAPKWPNRDRFVLSCGHASILQYSFNYLLGQGLELDDLKSFRQLKSATPGHPEAHHTESVEVTTGPLGQGFANSVGLALAERLLSAKHGTDAIDHYTYVIVSDGDLSEGISHEAGSLAGHLGLGKLIAIYDDNKITIDGSTDLSLSDDAAARFRAYGWDVVEVGAASEDLDLLESTIRAAQSTDKPTMIIMQSEVGFPSPKLTGNHKAHGLAFDEAEITATKEVMGIPDEPFYVPDEVLEAYRSAGSRSQKDRIAWEESNGDLFAGFESSVSKLSKELTVEFEDKPLASRKASQACVTEIASKIDTFFGGAADLTGNTGLEIDSTPQASATPGGRQVYFGIREHAQAACLVGAAAHGGVLPISGTFLVFADYMRPAIRLAALSGTHCVFVFTHDSIGVGEDGPTHQPVEQVMSLRSIPGLQVIRPADSDETVSAWRQALAYDGPTVLVMSRQNLPPLAQTSQTDVTGGYVVQEADDAQVTLVSAGSEVALAVEAAELLAADSISARVVSMPNWHLFERQSDGYKKSTLGDLPTVSIEAGVTLGWHKYADVCIGLDRFGESGPASEVFKHLGITAEATHAAAKELLSK